MGIDANMLSNMFALVASGLNPDNKTAQQLIETTRAQQMQDKLDEEAKKQKKGALGGGIGSGLGALTAAIPGVGPIIAPLATAAGGQLGAKLAGGDAQPGAGGGFAGAVQGLMGQVGQAGQGAAPSAPAATTAPAPAQGGMTPVKKTVEHTMPTMNPGDPRMRGSNPGMQQQYQQDVLQFNQPGGAGTMPMNSPMLNLVNNLPPDLQGLTSFSGALAKPDGGMGVPNAAPVPAPDTPAGQAATGGQRGFFADAFSDNVKSGEGPFTDAVSHISRGLNEAAHAPSEVGSVIGLTPEQILAMNGILSDRRAERYGRGRDEAEIAQTERERQTRVSEGALDRESKEDIAQLDIESANARQQENISAADRRAALEAKLRIDLQEADTEARRQELLTRFEQDVKMMEKSAEVGLQQFKNQTEFANENPSPAEEARGKLMEAQTEALMNELEQQAGVGDLIVGPNGTYSYFPLPYELELVQDAEKQAELMTHNMGGDVSLFEENKKQLLLSKKGLFSERGQKALEIEYGKDAERMDSATETAPTDVIQFDEKGNMIRGKSPMSRVPGP